MLTYFTLQFFKRIGSEVFPHVTAMFVKMSFSKEEHILIKFFICLMNTLHRITERIPSKS